MKRLTPVRKHADGAASACGGLYPGLSSRLLTMADLPAVEALRAAVLADLEVPDLYVPEEPEFMPEHISGCGVTIGIFASEDLVAYSSLGFGGADHAEMAAALRLDRDSFGHLASCMVATRWRQRGLHQWLIDRRIEHGLRHGLRHFAAMVSPYNDASWSNLMRHGLYLRAIARLHGERLRYLVHQDATESIRFDEESLLLCDPADIGRQSALLAEGFWGCRRERVDGQLLIGFAVPRRFPRR